MKALDAVGGSLSDERFELVDQPLEAPHGGGDRLWFFHVHTGLPQLFEGILRADSKDSHNVTESYHAPTRPGHNDPGRVALTLFGR